MAIDLQRAILGPNPDLVVPLNNYGQFLNQHGRFQEAEEVVREAYDHAEVHGSPFVDAAREGLVTALLRLDGADEAVELVREDLTRAGSAEERRLLADQLARLLEQLGRPDEARTLREEYPSGDP